MEKIINMVNELNEARMSHPAIKLLNERAEEAVAVGVEAVKAIAGVESLDDEAANGITDDAINDEARIMQLELLWDIRDSLTVSTPNLRPVAASDPGENEFHFLAGELYEEYCSAVGCKAHESAMPSWEYLCVTSKREKDAWMQVAGKAIAILA